MRLEQTQHGDTREPPALLQAVLPIYAVTPFTMLDFPGKTACIIWFSGCTMRCPYCQSEDTQVKDSRPAEDGAAIRRRRVCPDCGGRFTTFERVQLRDLVVAKKSGRKVPFDRDKLLRSVEVAVRKRNVDPDRIDRAVTGIVRQLESSGESEIPSEEIGRLVMEALKSLDDVAYVRFASVYRNFREAKDFHDVLGELKGDEDDR